MRLLKWWAEPGSQISQMVGLSVETMPVLEHCSSQFLRDVVNPREILTHLGQDWKYSCALFPCRWTQCTNCVLCTLCPEFLKIRVIFSNHWVGPLFPGLGVGGRGEGDLNHSIKREPKYGTLLCDMANSKWGLDLWWWWNEWKWRWVKCKGSYGGWRLLVLCIPLVASQCI